MNYIKIKSAFKYYKAAEFYLKKSSPREALIIVRVLLALLMALGEYFKTVTELEKEEVKTSKS